MTYIVSGGALNSSHSLTPRFPARISISPKCVLQSLTRCRYFRCLFCNKLAFMFTTRSRVRNILKGKSSCLWSCTRCKTIQARGLRSKGLYLPLAQNRTVKYSWISQCVSTPHFLTWQRPWPPPPSYKVFTYWLLRCSRDNLGLFGHHLKIFACMILLSASFLSFETPCRSSQWTSDRLTYYVTVKKLLSSL